MPFRLLLWPLTVAYGLIARGRAWLYGRGWLKQKRLNGAVISVGNLTVGGTGKTPMVLWLAERLLAQGKRVAILSRGYGGSGGTSDEVELLRARLGPRVPIGVGKNRFGQGKQLEAEKIDVYLLDDGFQYLQLARDLDIVLLDGSQPLSQEWLLPAGRLREPLSALRRASIIVITRKRPAPEMETSIRRCARVPVLYASTRLLSFRRITSERILDPSNEIENVPVYAFCGIGNPAAFFTDLERWGISIAGRASFRDHHAYTPDDFRRLEGAATRVGARALLTTEKDAQNFGDLRFIALPLYLCQVELELSGETKLWNSIERLFGRVAEVAS